MGCCASLFDNIPDVPAVIKPDPPTNQPVVAESARLGYFGWSHDFGIWENQRPKDSKEQKETMWLWFRKRQESGSPHYRIQIENFLRTNPEQPKLGQVLYYAVMQGSPQVQYFHRNIGVMGFYTGIMGDGGYQSYNDDFYANRCPAGNEHAKRRITGRHTVMTKWQSYSTTRFYDGTLGRGEGNFGKGNALLDVVTVGTMVTRFIDYEDLVEDRNEQGEVTGSHWQHGTEIHVQKFVDSIQFRLSVNGQFWTQWQVPGDCNYTSGDVIIQSPFFTTTLEGGWFKRATYRIQTHPGIDPAFAMLLSHVISTEYSVEEVKKDANVPTPPKPGFLAAFQPPSGGFAFQLPPLSGQFVYHC